MLVAGEEDVEFSLELEEEIKGESLSLGGRINKEVAHCVKRFKLY